MAREVGHATAKIRVRKQPFQYVSPYQREMDIDVKEYVAIFDAANFRSDNIYFDKTLGALTVAPLFANRDNYLINSEQPEPDEFKTEVPRGYINEFTGTAEETQNERLKRVWRSYPNEYQAYVRTIKASTGSKPSDVQRGDYVDPWDPNTEGDSFEGPRFEVNPRIPIYTNDEKEETSYSNWVEQTTSSSNVEWFLMQEYGNFANESFWMDVVKYRKAGEPDGPKGVKDLTRYITYGKSRPIHAYFGIRIGWDQAAPVMSRIYQGGQTFSKTEPVVNAGTQVGPYDIIFPIDGVPFIYDHEGDSTEPDTGGEVGTGEDTTDESDDQTLIATPFQYKGYVAAEAPDQSWTLRDDIEKFRLSFWILRGKLVIYASWTDTPWVFPANISSKATEATRSRYENFLVPPARVCLMGRGFRFLFSMNPMEFNIMENGQDREITKGNHGKIVFPPIPERRNFPSGSSGGWRDYLSTGTDLPFVEGAGNSGADSSKNGAHNFTLIPNEERTRLQTQTNPDNEDLVAYSYGFDIVDSPYEGFGSSGTYTSMMISVDGTDPYAIPSGATGETRVPKDLVNSYFRGPTFSESESPFEDMNGSQFGFDVTVETGNALFEARFPVVEMNCRAPDLPSGGLPMFTENISRRFASPVFWRIKAFHYVPDPVEEEWLDISSFVRNVSYEMSAPDMSSVRQNASIQIQIPKAYEFESFANDSIGGDNLPSQYTGGVARDNLLSLLYSGVLEVEVWMGWMDGQVGDPALIQQNAFGVFQSSDFESVNGFGDGNDGDRARIFRGIGRAGPLNQSFALDTMTLTCQDKLEILNGQIILNSPIYDGMATDNAFLHVGQLNGLPRSAFDVRSASAFWHILPIGFTFQEPKVRFKKNSTIYDAVRQIASYFMHIVQTDPDGRIVLRDLYFQADDLANDNFLGAAKSIDELNPTHDSYIFYVDGWKDEYSGTGGGSGTYTPNPFQTIFESFQFNKSIEDQMSQLIIMTIDRNDGAILQDARAIDVPAIENPDAKNFIGYSKPGRYQDPALGDERHLFLFKDNYTKRVMVPPMTIQFTTYGRPTLRPLDIIGVYHTHNLEINEVLRQKGVQLHPNYSADNYLQYRITSVKGTLQYDEAKWQYSIDVSAEHL